MVTPDDVQAAYRLILNREAESVGLVYEHTRRVPDLRSLRDLFLDSAECEATRVPKIPAILDLGSPIRVDVNVDDSTLQRMFDRVEKTWRRLGNEEPHWSVVTDEKFKKSTFATHATHFYDTGQHEVNRMDTWLIRNQIDTSAFRSCCEYGCGTGRVTCWLAKRFSRVHACDISEPHLRLAQSAVADSGASNVSFTRVLSPATIPTLEKVDAVFSIIVLQHNPPPIIAFLLKGLLHILNPGGGAFIQIPTYRPGYSFDAERYLSDGNDGHMEMHLLPQRDVFAIASQESCDVIEMYPDGYVGSPLYLSHTFLFRKRRG